MKKLLTYIMLLKINFQNYNFNLFFKIYNISNYSINRKKLWRKNKFCSKNIIKNKNQKN